MVICEHAQWTHDTVRRADAAAINQRNYTTPEMPRRLKLDLVT